MKSNYFRMYGVEEEFGREWYPWVKVYDAHCNGKTSQYFDIYDKTCKKQSRDEYDCDDIALELSDGSVSTFTRNKQEKKAAEKAEKAEKAAKKKEKEKQEKEE